MPEQQGVGLYDRDPIGRVMRWLLLASVVLSASAVNWLLGIFMAIVMTLFMEWFDSWTRRRSVQRRLERGKLSRSQIRAKRKENLKTLKKARDGNWKAGAWLLTLYKYDAVNLEELGSSYDEIKKLVGWRWFLI